ncbi:MAG: PmoA family protein [Flavisolibacter sp.]|nr:PmoA family protein [Flavisolibacter sp.]
MKTKHFLVFILFASLFRAGHAQKIATLEVVLIKPTSSLSVPAKTDLDAITFLPDSVLNLVEVNGSKRTPVPYQIQNTDHRTLYWTVDPGKEKHTYELVKGSPSDAVNTVHAKMENGALLMESGNKKLLNYYYKTVYPPAGIDTSYRRSGFIHPLWTPHGQELTRIQPPDHYHHYGIWNPWTHVYFEKDTVDFWNIGDKKGTVRFAKFVSVTDGPVFSEFEALHEHVVFKKDGSEKVALNELQTVRVYQPQDNADYFIVDITSKMNCASESPFLIVAYRYAGMGWRTTEFWNNTNCEVLTSE